MILPALSVKLPYAEWLATGKKSIETRLWSTPYRGPLLICAGRSVMDDAWEHSPLRGMATCIRFLQDVRPMDLTDEAAACCEMYEGACAWCLHPRRMIHLNPVWVRGYQRLFPAYIEGGAFMIPEDRDLALAWLAWAQERDMLKYVRRQFGCAAQPGAAGRKDRARG
jgi:hypothetical protein